MRRRTPRSNARATPLRAMPALRAEAKLFVPGIGSVTPERARGRGRANDLHERSRDAFDDDDDDASSGLELASEDEREAMVREIESTVDGEASSAMEAVVTTDARAPLLGKHVRFADDDETTYGSEATSPRIDDGARAALLGERGGRWGVYGAIEGETSVGDEALGGDVAVDETMESENAGLVLDVSEDAMGSAAGAPLLASSSAGMEYGASEEAVSPEAWSDARVPLLPVVKESTYGTASPIRPSTKDGNVQRVKELKAPPPIDVETIELVEHARARELQRVDKAARTPLLSKTSNHNGNGMAGYGTIDDLMERDWLRETLSRNTAPYERFEEHEEETGRDEEMLQCSYEDHDEEDGEEGTLDDALAPSAPPMEYFDFVHERALVDDLCCVVWTVARERLDLLQPLFRLQGSGVIGRITLEHLRHIMEKLEPQRATSRALDRLEAMLCACGYTEDVTLSEFVHAAHAGTLAATRLTTGSGVHDAAILCGYLDELMSRTPASAQTALMLGGSRHKAWLDLPRLLAKNLEPDQLCLLIAVLDNADALTSSGHFIDVTAYQHWLRRAAAALHSSPLPRPPLDVNPAPSAPLAPEPTAEESAARRSRRDRLVCLWEERDALRRARA